VGIQPGTGRIEVREIIISTATDVGPEGYDHQTAHGLFNAFAAVSEAIKRKKAADPDR
jgi:hypothetical protein